MIWPDPSDLADVVMVTDEDVPEQAERFALALVPGAWAMTWEEWMGAAKVEAADSADEFLWSVQYESQGSDGR